MIKILLRLATLFRGRGPLKYLGTVAILIRALQKVTGTSPKTLYTHKLKDGEALVISNADLRR